jgi:hypothetical protein
MFDPGLLPLVISIQSPYTNIYQGIWLFTRSAIAKNVDGVTRATKAVRLGNVIGPGFNLVGFNLNSLSALSADQVMVMAGSAGTVEQFAVLALKAVGF